MPTASRDAVSRTTPHDASPPDALPLSPRRRATRARLMAAAEEVFAERGFHGASVEDLCERADFTRGAFYSNFASKDELLLELYAQHAARLHARVAEVAETPGLSLEQVLEAVFDVWTDDPEARRRWHLLTSEFALHALRDDQARVAWANLQRTLREELAEVVDRIAQAQHLRPVVASTELVRLIGIVLHGGLEQHLLDPEAVPPGSLERSFLPLLVRAAADGTAADRAARTDR
ncbi:TetR/AcrR family transcriptional regulator [Phycicoccus sp. Soil748]|uniref:TetR/AcrR family transcriptional regulator n=1 Tax=Phycicoccus sp. Soil748 TaxID=1736397 RepID=UPI0009E7EEB1|nr:TetR/AcrR family transcriptional regulator [Phycicoccus sp. Soil748]